MNLKETLVRISYGAAIVSVTTTGCEGRVDQNAQATPIIPKYTPIIPPSLDFSDEGMRKLREFAEERIREIELTLTPEESRRAPTPTTNLPPVRQS